MIVIFKFSNSHNVLLLLRESAPLLLAAHFAVIRFVLSYTGFDEIFLAQKVCASIIKHSGFDSSEAATAWFVIS